MIIRDMNVRLSRIAKRLRADARSGSAIVEFAMIAPIFFLLLFSIMEVGIIFFAQSNLQFANEIVGRLIRTGQVQGAQLNQTQVRLIVCAKAAPLIPCDSNLYVDVESFDNFGNVQFSPPLDQNGNINGMNNFQPGESVQRRAGTLLLRLECFHAGSNAISEKHGGQQTSDLFGVSLSKRTLR